jgi:hypothetical protein
MDKTYDVKLLYDELLLLDGKVSGKAQDVIDVAKKESTYGFDIPILNEILRASETNGKLTWRYKDIRSCPLCDKKYSYHTYSRSSRNHYKGETNYDSPMYYWGLAFNEGFVTIQGHGDFCGECDKTKELTHKLIDYILDNDLKIEIQKNDYKPTRYKYDPLRICFQCKEEIYESEMGDLPALMGGYYKGKCPKCSAESRAFGKSHEITNKFRLILVN